jgi:hypothetical protein
MSIRIDTLDRHHDAEYSGFLDALGATSASVLAYHYPFYRDVLTAEGIGEPRYLGAWDGEELVGVLPGFLKNTEVGTSYCSLPFFGPNAGVHCAETADAAAIHAELLGAVVSLMRAQKNPLSASIYTPFLLERFEDYDRALPDAAVVPKFTSYIKLPAAPWKKEINYDIRRAERLGVTVTSEITTERADRFYQIYAQNCNDYGIPLKPRRVIDALLSLASEGAGVDGRGRVSCRLAIKDQEVIAGLLMLWGPTTASYYLPCTAPDARSLQPGTVLIDDAVNEACRRGVRYWNWESSPNRQSGVFQYKMKWGSVESDYRIYALPFCELDRLRALSAEALARHLPFFFVFPYDRL